MLTFNVHHSVADEVARITNTLGRIDFYNEKGYTLCFPKGLQIVRSNSATPEHIKDAVEGEYNEESYNKEEEYIQESMPLIRSVLEKYSETTTTTLQDVYEVRLTKYGVGGSYHLPNTVIVNIQTRTGAKLTKTLIHEVIHLSIEEWVQKYSVEHWKKERIVDLIFERIAPELNSVQKLPIDTRQIDEVFEKHYPNIEEILKRA